MTLWCRSTQCIRYAGDTIEIPTGSRKTYILVLALDCLCNTASSGSLVRVVWVPLVSSPSGTKSTYQTITGTGVTDEILAKCAHVFSNNYGIWGENASRISRHTKAGQRVKMTPTKLRAQCLGIPERTVLSICIKNEEVVGHAFATIWLYDGGVVAWITQLVVDISVRKRYIATNLLQELKDHPLFSQVTTVGLVSSHPAACQVLAKYGNISVGSIDLNFIRDNATKILAATNVEYLKTAELRGSLFQNEFDVQPGVVSSAFTNFFVDHAEPLDALEYFKTQWCLGELLDGHEFLVILAVQKTC